MLSYKQPTQSDVWSMLRLYLCEAIEIETIKKYEYLHGYSVELNAIFYKL